jgi:putative transposase
MMRLDLGGLAGEYLTALMEWELTMHLGRKRYERSRGEVNHRNGSSPRKFTMKGLGEVEVKVPRDRQGQFQTKVLPRSRQYEEAVAQDLSLMFLAGISSRSLSLISQRLLGRKLSHPKISNANRELTAAGERRRTTSYFKTSII